MGSRTVYSSCKCCYHAKFEPQADVLFPRRYLDGVFDVFAINNGLSYIGADLTYLNFLVGVTVMFMFMPVQTWFFKRDRLANGGVVRPEARFITSLVAVWGFPIS
jgi:hypothetical protein